MIYFCLLFILLFISLVIYGLVKNLNIFIKILFLNSLTSIVALFICFLATFTDNDSYLDIAIIYFLLSFIATAAYLKYFLQQPND